MTFEVTCFVTFISVSCIDVMQEITSEKRAIFPRANCAALCREELESFRSDVPKIKVFSACHLCLVPIRE